MNNTLAWVLPAEILPLSRYFQGLQQSFWERALRPPPLPVLTALILVIVSCWGRLEIGLGWWVSAEWITSISPLGGPHTDKVRKNGFGFSLSIHGFLVEKWNFPTEGAGVPAVSVHRMFHLLLLFWKCNYLRYRGPKRWQFGRGAVPPAKGIVWQCFRCILILSFSNYSLVFAACHERKQSADLLSCRIISLATERRRKNESYNLVFDWFISIFSLLSSSFNSLMK